MDETLREVQDEPRQRVTLAGQDSNGEGGIRTPDTLARMTVFETVPISHSGTSPQCQ